jgi:hypothetical protein
MASERVPRLVATVRFRRSGTPAVTTIVRAPAGGLR